MMFPNPDIKDFRGALEYAVVMLIVCSVIWGVIMFSVWVLLAMGAGE